MRAELKYGLAVGAVVLLIGGVIWGVSNSRSGKQSDIPTNLKREDVNSPNSVSLANDPSRSSRDGSGARRNVNTPYNSGANPGALPSRGAATVGGDSNTRTSTPNSGTGVTGTPASPGTSTPPSASDTNRPRAETIIPAPSAARSTETPTPKPATTAPTNADAPPVTGAPPKSAADTVLTPAGGTHSNVEHKPLPPSGGGTGGAHKPEVAVPPKADAAESKPATNMPVNSGNLTTGMQRPSGGTPSGTPPAVTTSGETHTVQSGDTLSSIAEQKLGAERYWPLIQAANPGLDPDKIRIGQKIKLPSKETILAANNKPPETAKPSPQPTLTNSGNSASSATDHKAAAGGTTTYEVVKGDTLVEIAKKSLGDAGRWEEIFNLNRDQLPSPDRVRPGMKLKIPARKP